MNYERNSWHPAERLVHHVQALEQLEEEKKAAADAMRNGFRSAQMEGFDPDTLKAVLKLRKLPPNAIAERQALLNQYLVALGMLTEPLSDEARRRLDEDMRRQQDDDADAPRNPSAWTPTEAPQPRVTGDRATKEAQQDLPLKAPHEALEEGRQAARDGKGVFDNPYSGPRDTVLRAMWDRGWCQEAKSNGMEINKAWGRRTIDKPPSDPDAGDSESEQQSEREKEPA